eukprot:1330966-Pyramimonas_sp.AAC.1
MTRPGAQSKVGRARAKELPGPRYSGKRARKGETAPLASKAKAERIDFRGFCGIDVVTGFALVWSSGICRRWRARSARAIAAWHL